MKEYNYTLTNKMYLNSAIVSSPSTLSFSNRNGRITEKKYVPKRMGLFCVNKAQSKTEILKNSKVVSRSRLEIAETLNSRMAMLGVTCGSVTEYTTHKNYLDQVQITYPYVVVMGLLIGYATFKTMSISTEENRPFTMGIEMLNGRVAMMGVLAKILYDTSHI